jgi:transcription initiation factor TFIIB
LKVELVEAYLEKLSAILDIPKPVKDKAVAVYQKAAEEGLTKGRSSVAMAVAALEIVCRQSGVPVLYNELIEIGGVLNKDVERCRRLLLIHLGLFLPPRKPKQLVQLIAKRVGASDKAVETANQILDRAREKSIFSGRNISAIAAGALYIACFQNKEHILIRDIAKVAGVSEATVRLRWMELARELKLELPAKRITKF